MQDARAQYERLTASFENENRLCANLAADLKVSQTDFKQLASQAAEFKQALKADLTQERAKAERLARDLAAIVLERTELKDQNLALITQASSILPSRLRMCGICTRIGNYSGAFMLPEPLNTAKICNERAISLQECVITEIYCLYQRPRHPSSSTVA
jgi:hypothetical protein